MTLNRLRSRLSLAAWAAWLALLALTAIVRPVHAQTAPWSPPQQLSPPGAMASFPDLLIDPAGGAHVVWSSSDDLYDVVYYKDLAPNAPNWETPVDIIANPHNPGEFYVARPVLTLDEDWKLALGVHAPGDLLSVANAPAATARDPFAWTDNQLAPSGYHVLPLAAGGLLHVVYTQSVPGGGCPQCLHLLYTNSSDLGENWSDPIDISRRQDRGTAKPQLLAGRDGALHLVWESGLDGDRGYVTGPARVMYAASYDNGTSWSQAFELDNLGADDNDEVKVARNVAIAQAGDGTLLATWWQMPEDLVFYRTSTDMGRTWSAVNTVPSVWGVGNLSRTRQDAFSMVTDSSGAIHLLMAGRLGVDDATVSMLELVYQAGTWSFPRTIATYDSDLPEWPRAAVGLGNQLRVVWHVRLGALLHNDPDASWAVWESHVTLPVAPIPAVAAPAAAASSAAGGATVTPANPATATPSPTLMPAAMRAEPASPVTMQTLMSENDDVALLALALLPVLLLVAGGLIWRRRSARK